ncbi:MAG TPA: class I SAM-dependent methyltransferase [Actinomycetes bacterium]|nr:class I SAM-dependent methyltransferase [Actinomycetes bacterium]
MTEGQLTAVPTLADQVSRLYDLIGGFHATHLMEIARELGVWQSLTEHPGMTSDELAAGLDTDPFYTDVLCRTAFAYSILARDGAGWRMAPHFDQILGDPNATFFLGTAARVHVKVGEDYKDYAQHFREGTRSSYQAHDGAFMEDVALATASLPRIFLDFVLPQLPALQETLSRGERLFDLGCGGGWAVTQIAERFPNLRCIGADVEPYSVDLAQTLIRERNLEDRCEARVGSAEWRRRGSTTRQSVSSSSTRSRRSQRLPPSRTSRVPLSPAVPFSFSTRPILRQTRIFNTCRSASPHSPSGMRSRGVIA